MAFGGADVPRSYGLVCLGVVLTAVALTAVALGAAGATGATAAAGVGGQSGVADAAANPGPVEAALDDRQPLAVSDVRFTQRSLGNVFLENETVRVGVETGAPGVQWRVHDYRGRLVASGSTAVDGEQTLTLPVETVGHYTIRARTTTAPAERTPASDETPASDGTPVSDATSGNPTVPASATSTTLAVLPADDFDNDDEFYGMSTQFNADWDRELMAVMDRAGVATVREDSGWAAIEQSSGEYDFSSSDGYMVPLGDRGFDRLYILAYGNPLHDPNGGEYFTMPYTDGYRQAFADFSRSSVRHYDGVDHVEVWNEPNLEGFASGPAGTDPAAYAALLEATYPAVKAERENVTVVGGSATGNYSGATPMTLDRPWWEGLLAAGGARHMDAMAIHLYRDEPVGFDEDLAELRALTREHNDGETLPVWVTELGWQTTPANPGGEPESTQARNVVRSHARLQAADVERLYWYTFRDTTFGEEADPQTVAGNAQFGFLRGPSNPKGANTPKPGLVGYAVMTRQLAGSDVVAEGTDPVERYTFANGSERTHVLWNATRTDVTLHTDDPVTVTSMTGDETRLRPRDGEVYLTVGRDPVYVAGTVTNVSRGAPVSVAGPVTTDAADEFAVGATAGAESWTVTHRVGASSTTVTAAAGESATGSLDVPPSYRDRAATAVDVVSVEGRPVGRLTTPVDAPTARLGDPSSFSGLTVETWNTSAGWFTEANDVGTQYSQFDVRTREGRACWESDVDAGRPGLGWYVDVADGHADRLEGTVDVTVTYFDEGTGELVAQYDGPSDDADWGGTLTLSDTGTWRSHTFEFSGAQFANDLGAGHDFRLLLNPDAGNVCLGSVVVGSEPVAPPNGSVTATSTPPATATSTAAPPTTEAIDAVTDAETDSGPSGSVSPATPPTRSADGPGFGPVVAVAALVAFVAATRHRR